MITLSVKSFEEAYLWWRHESWPKEECQGGVKHQWGYCHPAATIVVISSTIANDCHLLLGCLQLLIAVCCCCCPANVVVVVASAMVCFLMFAVVCCCTTTTFTRHWHWHWHPNPSDDRTLTLSNTMILPLPITTMLYQFNKTSSECREISTLYHFVWPPPHVPATTYSDMGSSHLHCSSSSSYSSCQWRCFPQRIVVPSICWSMDENNDSNDFSGESESRPSFCLRTTSKGCSDRVCYILIFCTVSGVVGSMMVVSAWSVFCLLVWLCCQKKQCEVEEYDHDWVSWHSFYTLLKEKKCQLLVTDTFLKKFTNRTDICDMLVTFQQHFQLSPIIHLAMPIDNGTPIMGATVSTMVALLEGTLSIEDPRTMSFHPWLLNTVIKPGFVVNYNKLSKFCQKYQNFDSGNFDLITNGKSAILWLVSWHLRWFPSHLQYLSDYQCWRLTVPIWLACVCAMTFEHSFEQSLICVKDKLVLCQ